jgi:hypothetical protein
VFNFPRGLSCRQHEAVWPDKESFAVEFADLPSPRLKAVDQYKSASEPHRFTSRLECGDRADATLDSKTVAHGQPNYASSI